MNKTEKLLQLVQEGKDDWVARTGNTDVFIKNIGKHFSGDDKEKIGKQIYDTLTKILKGELSSASKKIKKITIEF